MKKVSAFQTADGKVHTDELDAIQHERLIEIRDMITTHFNSNLATSLPPIQIASFIAAKGDSLNELNQKFKRKILGYSKRKPATV
jgi:protein-disulfide isomerase-like protein with CxxC motif